MAAMHSLLFHLPGLYLRILGVIAVAMSLVALRGFVIPSGDERRSLSGKSRVVPVVKDIGWLSETSAADGRTPFEYAHEPLNEQLVIVYAEDRSSRIRYLTRKEVAAMDLEPGQLRALAAANLGNILPPVSLRRGNAVAMVVAGGDYEASLLAAPELWSAKMAAEGELVVAIPARDLLLVTGTGTPGGVAQLREAASTLYREASNRLTPDLFVYRDGRFTRID